MSNSQYALSLAYTRGRKQEKEKNYNDVDADVAQLEYRNNKCYTSTFR